MNYINGTYGTWSFTFAHKCRDISIRYTVPRMPYRIPYLKLRYDKYHTDTILKFRYTANSVSLIFDIVSLPLLQFTVLLRYTVVPLCKKKSLLYTKYLKVRFLKIFFNSILYYINILNMGCIHIITLNICKTENKSPPLDLLIWWLWLKLMTYIIVSFSYIKG